MDKWIDKIFNLKSFPGKLIFVLWLSSLLIVFLPASLLEKMLLVKFKADYGSFIGPVLLISSGIIIWMIGKFIWDKVHLTILIKNRRKQIIEDLNYLNYNEQRVLREFYIQNKDTILAPINDETVISLEKKSLIYKATSSAIVNGMHMGFPYSISPIAKQNLSFSHLSLPIEEITDAHRRTIQSERPSWAVAIENERNMFKNLW